MPNRHRPGALVALAVIACVAFGGACRREQKHLLSSVEVVGPTVRENPQLGLTSEQVEGLFAQTLAESGHFVLPGTEADAKAAPAQLSLELPFTRASVKDGREGVWAEVGAALTIRRKVESVGVRYEVVGLGEERIAGEGDRVRAMQVALRRAFAQVVGSAHLQLAALDKSDLELERDLRSGEPAAREFALRILSERRNPAVVDALIERLRAEDPDQIRQAMGALAELRAAKAVRPLIDLTRGKNPVFVREVLFALAQIGGDEATAYLYTMAQGHDDPALREAAQRALGEIEGGSP